ALPTTQSFPFAQRDRLLFGFGCAGLGSIGPLLSIQVDPRTSATGSSMLFELGGHSRGEKPMLPERARPVVERVAHLVSSGNAQHQRGKSTDSSYSCLNRQLPPWQVGSCFTVRVRKSAVARRNQQRYRGIVMFAREVSWSLLLVVAIA